MPEEATNTEKIQTLVAKIPSLSEAWSNAIEDQNDDTIWGAWSATIEHFFPNTKVFEPESVLKLLKSKKLPCKNPSDFYHPIKLIADILIDLWDELCFGEAERLWEDPIKPKGIINTGVYYIEITKTLDGFFYEVSEDDASWFSNKRHSNHEICHDYEQKSIEEFYDSWVLVFSIEEKGNPENSIYSLFASDDEMFYYVEEQGQPDGEYQTSAKEAFDYSSDEYLSCKIGRNGTLKITEGLWSKDKILQHFEWWQDVNIEWIAGEDYTKAINLDPKDATNYIARGHAYSNLKKYTEAAADYVKAIELDPMNAGAYYSRGRAYFYLKKYPQAIADYTKAIELDPKDASAYFNRGHAYRNLKKYEEEITDYTKAIELDPKGATNYYFRGECVWQFREVSRGHS